ncbi:GlcNAc-PI de-N-acetylase-domain-containing protein [Aspergillus alliaceus]|uniref:N-acetylglucosaminylphosphatidylinositol deacetylase n=1 Tax=Petromyces alliaceus TaxID=209559 RepID=A0A5N7CJ49_PETAA|nr:GlcNAc-PI de-N-acetylase-domain-containing protein [Aspergillus alliaceus]KAB8234024.1 GlcNAc-PI de-N-acetylase-domain-containing protein [Aspergillus alliaceus]KAE8394135.1 GlcNAc-PI de-N-acetylase-domain-containing protein [Aspergillus alliaceus]
MRLSNFLSSLAILGPITLSAAQTLNIVAHQDDDLLFMSPDLLNDVRSGRAVRTVFLTAGDAGNGEGYWTGRQAGSLATYARIAKVDNDWEEGDAGIEGFDIPVYSLSAKPQIELAFLHIPDGNMDGSGFASTGSVSLQKLWEESIDQIGTVDASGTTYTKDELLDVLVDIIENFDPDRINTLDYVNDVGSGDHSDHYTTGYFADHASQLADNNANFFGYMGYPVRSLSPNLDAATIADKKDIFYFYAGYDAGTCHSDEGCAGRPELDWLARQYMV